MIASYRLIKMMSSAEYAGYQLGYHTALRNASLIRARFAADRATRYACVMEALSYHRQILSDARNTIGWEMP